MHFNLKRAVGVMAIPLLGSALAVGATALPAHAQTWQDTALSASTVTLTPWGGGTLTATSNTVAGDITLSATGTVTWSLNGTRPVGVTLTGPTTIGYSGTTAPSSPPPDVIADATDSAGNVEVLLIPVTYASLSIQVVNSPFTGAASLSTLADSTTSGTVTFSATSADTITYAESSLPAGLVSGSPTLTYVGGTAAPATYGGVKVTATDPTNGAVQKGTFSLTVYASNVYTAGTAGNEVNPFGNGFDVYQQHRYPGAVIAGWTATQADPATHFLLFSGTHSGAVRLEYAPDGGGTGLCVSDPGGGWASDPLPDGLILTWCNNGPWQQFVPQSNGTLKNVATGLVVNPAGTGAQLRGGTTVTPWGGSVYGWTDYASLPV